METAGESATPQLQGHPTRADHWSRGLLVLLALLLVHSAWRVGPTFDEHFYIASGFSYLQEGDFSLNREHPPLLKVLMALPLWLGYHTGLLDLVWPEHGSALLSYPTAFFYGINGEGQQLHLFLARLPMVGLCLWMVAACARRARRQFGGAASVAVVLLLGFNPTVLGHGHIAALDMGVTALMFLATLAVVELFERERDGRPLARAALWAAVAFGLANLAKSTALLLGPITLLLGVVCALRAKRLRPLGLLLLVWFGGLGVFALGYGFEAKSVNEAWGTRQYVASARPVKGAGTGKDANERITELRAELARVLPSDDDAPAAGLYRELGRFANDGQELRKRAAGLLVYDPGTRFAAERMASLERLTGRSFETLEGWRAWYEEQRTEDWDVTIFTQPALQALTAPFGTTRPIPLFSALKGLDYQLKHAHEGHTSVYNGEPLFSPQDFKDGNPYPQYYLHMMALKNPLPWLLLTCAGLVVLWRQRWSAAQLVGFVAFPAVLFYVFSTSNMLMGVRYVLPVFPFLAFIGAACAVHWPRATLTLAAASALLTTWHHPHELMYYNAIAGGNDLREGGPAVSPVSDDWGQGVRAFSEWVAEHRAELDAAGGLHYVPLSPAGPMAFDLWGVSADKGPGEGIWAVHALNYWRDSTDPDTKERLYAWLDDYEPFLVIDESIYVFDTRPGKGGTNPFE